jgi:hypothetical protein
MSYDFFDALIDSAPKKAQLFALGFPLAAFKCSDCLEDHERIDFLATWAYLLTCSQQLLSHSVSVCHCHALSHYSSVPSAQRAGEFMRSKARQSHVHGKAALTSWYPLHPRIVRFVRGEVGFWQRGYRLYCGISILVCHP